MTETSFGSGIQPVAMPAIESDDAVTPVPMPTVDAPAMPTVAMPDGMNIMDFVDAIKAGIRHEMDAAVADIERRLSQAREMEMAAFSGVPRQSVFTEDLNIGKHMIDGYTLTANSPAAGSIAWASLHIVLLGVDYTITDGNTNNKYVWFVKPGAGTTATLNTGNTMPTLGANDALIFINNSGTPISVLESSIAYAVGPGAIGNAQLDSATQTLLTNLQANDIALQANIDGAITSYYQDAAPWAAGTAHNGDTNMGDVWYDSNDGGAFRWTGSSGTPANTWQRIADTDTSSIAALVNTKVTTYLSANASPPTAPAGGFSTGDMWLVTDQGNKMKRWSGSAWVDVLLGDSALSGITAAKISGTLATGNIPTLDLATKTSGSLDIATRATGVLPTANVPTIDIATKTSGSLDVATRASGVLPAANVPTLDISTKTSGNLDLAARTTGTLAGSKVGSGVAPSNLTGAGTVPLAGIPSITPAKINAAFHMLY